MSAHQTGKVFSPSRSTNGGGGDASTKDYMDLPAKNMCVVKTLTKARSRAGSDQDRPPARKPGFMPRTCTKLQSTPNKFKKAASMENLTPELQNKELVIVRRTPLPPSVRVSPGQGLDVLEVTQLLAHRRIFQLLMLNAWRKSRTHVTVMESERENLANEVRNMNLQVSLLKTLLESEKERNKATTRELQQVNVILDETTEELQAVRQNKEEEGLKLACQDLQMEELRAKCSHLLTEVRTTKEEHSVVLDRINRYDEEANSLRERNSQLLFQVATQNEVLTTRNNLIKNLQKARAELKKKLADQTDAMEVMDKQRRCLLASVDQLNAELQQRAGEVAMATSDNRALTQRVEDLLSQGKENNAEIASLRSQLERHQLQLSRMTVGCQLRQAVSCLARAFSRVLFLSSN